MIDRGVAIVSGGFDPIHKGHVRLINSASRYGEVLVILNSDPWLERKKGYSFMSWEEREEILLSIRGVFEVVLAKDDDGTVCKSLREIAKDYGGDKLHFVNGGDRKNDNVPEVKVCKELDIKMIWGAGGGKIQSSSELVNRMKEHDKQE